MNKDEAIATFLTALIAFVAILVAVAIASRFPDKEPARLQTFSGAVVDRIERKNGFQIYFTDGRHIRVSSEKPLRVSMDLLEEAEIK